MNIFIALGVFLILIFLLSDLPLIAFKPYKRITRVKPERLLAYTIQRQGLLDKVMLASEKADSKYLYNRYRYIRLPHLDEPIKNYKKRIKIWNKNIRS